MTLVLAQCLTAIYRQEENLILAIFKILCIYIQTYIHNSI